MIPLKKDTLKCPKCNVDLHFKLAGTMRILDENEHYSAMCPNCNQYFNVNSKKEMTITKKAYEIDRDRLEEGYLSDNIICHAENLNKAKVELLRTVRYDDWRLKYINKELTYLNIPVKRIKIYDKVIFEGQEITRNEIDKIIRERERNEKLNKILNDSNIEYCYIWKSGYYKPNSSGYTYLKHEAGIFPKKEAVNSAKSVQDITLEPVNVNEHNNMIFNIIKQLEKNIIK